MLWQVFKLFFISQNVVKIFCNSNKILTHNFDILRLREDKQTPWGNDLILFKRWLLTDFYSLFYFCFYSYACVLILSGNEIESGVFFPCFWIVTSSSPCSWIVTSSAPYSLIETSSALCFYYDDAWN